MEVTKQSRAKQLLLAISLGCLTMFIWGGLSHMVFFTGTGFKQLPNEDKVIEALQSSIKEQGLYFYPGKEFKNSTSQQEVEWEKKFRSGPAGILISGP